MEIGKNNMNSKDNISNKIYDKIAKEIDDRVESIIAKHSNKEESMIMDNFIREVTIPSVCYLSLDLFDKEKPYRYHFVGDNLSKVTEYQASFPKIWLLNIMVVGINI